MRRADLAQALLTADRANRAVVLQPDAEPALRRWKPVLGVFTVPA